MANPKGFEREARATDNSVTITALNDELRRSLSGGRILLSRSVAALSNAEQLAIITTVRNFDSFTADNDPYGEHDCALFDAAGHRCMFKIDYYDKGDPDSGSDDPADVNKTLRVLTIMLASDY